MNSPESTLIEFFPDRQFLKNHPMIECMDCGWLSEYSPTLVKCHKCSNEWLEARYDYGTIGRSITDNVSNRPFNLWRYRELLPVEDYYPELSMGEGGTPLIKATNLGVMLGCSNLYIKDERQGPTGSFKDRQAAVNIAALKEAGITEIVLASTGNVAISYSAYASRAGIKLWAFLTSLVPPEKMREVAIYGTEVVKVTCSYDQAKKIAAEFAKQRGLYLERGARSIPSIESMKTIAYETSEQLGKSFYRELGEKDHSGSKRWVSPDWYFQSVSGGLGPLGVWKGFQELLKMNLIDRVPKIACIQAEGCAPMVTAWKANLETVKPVQSPRTYISTLSTGDPGRAYSILYHRSRRGGAFESVTDEEAFRAMHILAKLEGLSVEPAAAVAFAGLIKLIRSGTVHPDETIVVNCTGHTMPIESSVLGAGWSIDIALPSTSKHGKFQMETPEEGLLAALNRVTADRFPRVLIVDDTEEARRLTRRILQSQGTYTLFEANDGIQAIEISRKETPDIIILDLMMPEMDGFSVLDKLKSDPLTSGIPVIVVTAKELTIDEQKNLSGRIQSLMQKGEFLSDDLIGIVRGLTEN